MALGGCYSCLKYLMFAFNFLFWVAGCLVLGIGIWLRVDPNVFKYINKDSEVTLSISSIYMCAYVLIAVGSIIMILGFLGCCGAIRESQCMLATFFVFLFIIFAILLAAGIFVVLPNNQDEIKMRIDLMLNESVKYYFSNKTTDFMDFVQKELNCCGATVGVQDWINTGNGEIPSSCASTDDNKNKPCSEKVLPTVKKGSMIAAGVAIGTGFVMLLGMIISMMLCCAIKDQWQ